MWQGRSVGGKFPLRQWLGGSDHSAVFLTERPGGGKAAIKLIAVEAGDVEQALLRVRASTRLSHPHLIHTFEAGRGQLDGDSFVYVVMEFAEEDLSQVLPQRALSPEEVSDLLPPLLDAVSYVHNKGFVHSRVKPSNILAVANALKLSADQITPVAETGSVRRRDVYDAPETAAGVLTPASDVWSLGATLIAAITQNVALIEQSPGGARPKAFPNLTVASSGTACNSIPSDDRRCSRFRRDSSLAGTPLRQHRWRISEPLRLQRRVRCANPEPFRIASPYSRSRAW